MIGLTICIDFDGTIVDHRFPGIGKPVPHAIESIKKLQKYHDIILYTMRSDGGTYGSVLSEAAAYCRENGIDFDGINHNPTQVVWTNSPKVLGNFYIDDAAVGCPLIKPYGFYRHCVDWLKIMEMLKEVGLTL